MPYVIERPKKSFIALVAACLALLVVAHPASAASTTCATPSGFAIGSGRAVTANLYFTTTGKWQIDDVYVDPYTK